MNVATLAAESARASHEARSLLERLNASAAAEGRPLGAGEHAAIQSAVNEARSLKARLERAQSDDQFTDTVRRLESAGSGGGMSMPGGSLGTQFVASDTFRWLKENRNRLPEKWTSASSELVMMAATLSEDGASGGALVVPDYRPGILALPQRPLTIADLVAPGTTDSNLISFMKEVSFSNAAAAVAEAGTKPESTIVFAPVTSAVKKIAHWLPVTEELLEDSAAARSFIDARLRLGVQLTEDAELLNGTGLTSHLLGFTALPGLTAAQARGTDTNADAILKQIAAIQTATNLAPSGLVLHPSNWITIQLLKTAAGEYISGRSPFSAPVGPSLWGLPVALTTAITVNTALVGAFRTAAQIFRKGGLRVEVSNSHASFFVENKVAIRAEERLALAVYREAAFGLVTGLN